MESTYRLIKTAKGIVQNKDNATMPQMVQGLWEQAKELFGEAEAKERFCPAGFERPNVMDLLPMSAAIGAHLAQHGNVTVVTDKTKEVFRTGINPSTQEAIESLARNNAKLASMGLPPVVPSTSATPAAKKDFPSLVAAKVAGGKMTKAQAVAACVKEFPDSHREWLMSGNTKAL